MKRILSLVLSFSLLLSLCITVNAENETNYVAEDDGPGDVDATSAVLMEAESGRVLWSKDKDGAYPPASVTKIMTLLLAAEALDRGQISLSDTVCVSKHASEMGGSQVFLEEGESITVDELFKSTVIASANDAAVALAELVKGSEKAFVTAMNARAAELGLKSTRFENATGLDDTVTDHVMSAYDIAVISRELIKHEIVTRYSSLWQDTIRNGEFTLTNTNRLVRFYDGCNGLKTGSTDKAGFCMTATAKRDGMQLITVVMGAPSRDERNAIARELLDYGFATYTVIGEPETVIEEVPVMRGAKNTATLYSAPFSAVILSADKGRVEKNYRLPEVVNAPLTAMEELGYIEYTVDGRVVGKSAIYSKEDVGKIGYFDVFLRMLGALFKMQ